MKLVPCSMDDIQRVGVNTDIFGLLNEFSESDLDCVKVDGYKHKTAVGCATAIRESIKRYRMFNIQVIQRKDNVFLIKKK